jgi:endonuclease/exonuclease/phosphatase family metal-dependent hydrolase
VTHARLAFALAGLCACIEQHDDAAPWQDLDALDGPLAAGVGPAPRELAPAPGCVVRVASFNVHFAEDPEALAAHLRAARELSRADAILIQEMRAFGGEPVTRARRLAEALGMTWIYAPARELPGGTHGLAIVSRHPLEAAAVRRLPFLAQPHHAEQRIALAVDLVLGDDRLRVVDVHLDLRMAPADRIRQLYRAFDELPERLLLGGDLNTTPWTWAGALVPVTSSQTVVGRDQARIIDDFMAAFGFAGAIAPDVDTMRDPTGIDMRLDNLYARELPIVAAGVEHVEGSDHWPVWVDVDRCR